MSNLNLLSMSIALLISVSLLFEVLIELHLVFLKRYFSEAFTCFLASVD